MRKTRLFAGYALLFAVSAAACTMVKSSNTLPSLPVASRAHSGAPRFEHEHLWNPVGDNHWEPVVAADRGSRWVYQMTTQQRPDYLLFRASSDGGRTWGAPRHLCHRGLRVPFQYDPQIAVTKGGTVDVVCLDGFRPGAAFARSRDHGATWSKAVRLDGSMSYSDKPTLVLASGGKDVYVSYNARYALYVSASHDYGATWAAPVRATTRRLWYYSYGGTADRDGTVWFAVDGEDGKNETGEGHVGLVTSADRGRSWREVPFAVSREGARCERKNCYPDFYTAQDAVAADERGDFVFVFAKNERKHGPNFLYASRSSDDGRTWSDPRAISTAGNAASPALVAAPDGGFRLVWQDDRNGHMAWNTWYAQSDDAGASWTDPIRLSDRGAGAPYKHAAGYNFPFGDYLGFAVDGIGVNHVIWGEGSAIYVPGGTWWTRGR